MDLLYYLKCFSASCFSLSNLKHPLIPLIGKIKVGEGNLSGNINFNYSFQLSEIGFTSISQTVTI